MCTKVVRRKTLGTRLRLGRVSEQRVEQRQMTTFKAKRNGLNKKTGK